MEDAYPDWLRRLSMTVGDGPYRTTISGRSIPGTNPSIVMKHYRFCEPCNNRLGKWNEHAIPTVKSMVVGQQTVLNNAEQVMVTAWIYRTLVSLDLTPGSGDMPDGEAHFLNSPHVPGHIRVWIGDFNYKLPRAETPSTPLDTDYGRTLIPGLYGAVIALNRLVVHMAAGSDPAIRTVRHPAEEAGHMIRLWPPISDAAVRWPPARRYNKAGLDDLGRALVRDGEHAVGPIWTPITAKSPSPDGQSERLD